MFSCLTLLKKSSLFACHKYSKLGKNTIFYFNFISFFFFCNRKSQNFASSKHSESICHGMKSQVPEMHKMFNQAKTSKFHTKLHFCNCTWAGYLECFHPRTTDAQRGNSLHCTAENSLPLPNFQVRPKHILSATPVQIFRFL